MTNRKLVLTAAMVLASGFGLLASEKKVPFKNLPPAVQKAIQEQTKGATVSALRGGRMPGTAGSAVSMPM